MSHMIQTAPYPHALAELVERCQYRKHEGWRVKLNDECDRDLDPEGNVVGRGMTLIITTRGFDTYDVERGPVYGVYHYFIVPAATYTREAWDRWLFEQFAKVELHECMENYFDVDGNRPFAPLHGPGQDPYTVHQYATDEAKRTRYTGEIVEPSTA